MSALWSEHKNTQKMTLLYLPKRIIDFSTYSHYYYIMIIKTLKNLFWIGNNQKNETFLSNTKNNTQKIEEFEEPENRNLLEWLHAIHEELVQNNCSGILFWSSLLSYHQNPNNFVRDIDVLVLKENGYADENLVLSQADYFYRTSERKFQYFDKDYKLQTKILQPFRNAFANRIKQVSLSFGLKESIPKLKPGLIIPNEGFYFHLKQMEYSGCSWRISHEKEIYEALSNKKSQSNNYLEWTYEWTDEVVTLDFFEWFNYGENNEIGGSLHLHGLIEYLDYKKQDIAKLLWTSFDKK